MLIESNWKVETPVVGMQGTAAGSGDSGDSGGAMSDRLPQETVTTLALLNLIRLLAAELVAGEHRHDVDRLIQAMDRKLDSTPLPRGTDVNDARAGIARAKELLRPYAMHVRDQARGARIRGPRPAVPRSSRYLQ
jgi:hypothetical protein